MNVCVMGGVLLVVKCGVVCEDGDVRSGGFMLVVNEVEDVWIVFEVVDVCECVKEVDDDVCVKECVVEDVG